MSMTGFLRRFVRDEAGATALEYGLILMMIAMVIITAVTTLGTKTGNEFTKTSSKLGNL
jgi:pilus assembly protein Flp/PilA